MSRKLALLLGNSTYGPGLPPLEKPDADIAALAKVLADPAIGGFDEVKPLLDATSATARLEVARFFARRSPDDLLLLYFSGHGLRDDRGGLYLAAQDTETDLLRGTAVPAAFISEEMDNCRSKRQILILDCCYSGAFERGAKGPAANPAIAFTGNGLGRFVLTASDSTQLAWEDVAANSTEGLSVFTRHLVRGLESGEADLDGDGLISVDELYDYVYARVVEENPRQTPGKSTSKQQGEIFLARNPVGPKLRPLPAELMQALDHPLATVREGAVRELGRFLRGSDAGMAKAARVAAEQARDDDSRRVARAAEEILAAASPAGVEPVPPSKTAPEPQPAPAPTSDEGHLSAPAPVPFGQAAQRLPHTSGPKAPSKVNWIALGVLALLVPVILWVAKATKDGGTLAKAQTRAFSAETPRPVPGPAKVVKAPAKEQTPAISTKVPKQPDPTQTLLTEAKSWPLAFADNFGSAKADPFEKLDSSDTCTRTGLISSGVLLLSAEANVSYGCRTTVPASPATVTTDFYLRVDVRKVQGPDEAIAGLLFGMNSAHYYALILKGNRYSLTDNSTRLLRSKTSKAIRSRQTNSLAVLARGADLILFINDQKVDQISGATLSSGRVGLIIESFDANKVTFNFDNLELRRRP